MGSSGEFLRKYALQADVEGIDAWNRITSLRVFVLGLGWSLRSAKSLSTGVAIGIFFFNPPLVVAFLAYVFIYTYIYL